ncbi:MFS general substrate transporter [Stereum hirsutum FP-91666 SS1]|uniref:MFS general substrate transporter n=1 Tax=Stereum hirsutum (strain FP-91666) TaxID=721885 RepID=UPI000440E24E|nr:MFS general substrate transporter [Stereum hirsutum FP-91666 SS1]EIM91270.1 MFS general substrate transporter [Stereum hirsutum FP-91666 SS1]
MVALAWCFYLNGWNDGTIGPLLPRIQEYYNIGFVVVSMIFVVNCFGFIFGATANVYLSDKLGFGKVMVLGAVAQAITYAMQIPEGPFAVRVVAYFLAGFGVAIQNAGMNGYAGSLKKNTAKKLGLLHGSYGIGAFTAPLASTYFSTATHWSYHFIISLGFAILNILVLVAVFRGRLLDEVLVEEGEEPGEVQVVQAGVARESKFKQIFTSRIVHYMAMFSIIYIGVEVTVGGWIVTFIIRERQGGPNAGYISSGFFGGLAAGRLGLVWINQKIGERRALFIYSVICIALEATVWAVPSLIENAVAVSLIGVLLGPMYPILVNYAKDVLPRWLLTGSLGWIVGIGQAGSAALPFVTGLLAAKYGIVSLQPLLISMMILMVGLWALIPKAQRRVD